MKKTLSLLIASLAIGFVIFAICYWGLGIAYYQSLSVSIGGAMAGLVSELFIRPYLNRRQSAKR